MVRHSYVETQVKALRCSCGSWIAYTEDKELLKMDFSTYSYDREEAWVMPYATQVSYERLVQSLDRFRQTNRWLDVGCGAGHLMSVARAANWEVIGTELSNVAVRRLQKKGYVVYNDFLQNLTEPKESFDVITLIEVLEHVPDPLNLFKQIHSFLRPGGCFYLTTPNASSLLVRLRGIETVLVPPDHLWIWSPIALKKLLLHTGFHPQKIWTDGLNPYKLFKKAENPTTNKVLTIRTERLRDISSRNFAFKALKNLVNFFVSTSALGETLKAIATKKDI